jgi:hypothetical protein
MKRVGPELKMPELKLPPFLSDLFFDLRQRGLLPIVALVVVAIAAVPFLLGGGSDEEEEGASAPPAAAPAALGGASGTDSSTLAVVEAKPGLRDYHKRLAHRKPTNPFKQRYTSSETKGAELNQTGSSTSSTTTVTTSSSSEATTVGGSSSTSPSSTSSPESGGGKPHLTFFTWGIDVRIAKSGGDGGEPDDSQEPVVKNKVLPQTPLPGPKAPVVTYMGLSRKAAEKQTGKVLLLVSPDVKEIAGARTCASGPPTDICELIEVSPGSQIAFLYGANEVRYTIQVLKLDLVVTGHG